MPNYYLFVRYFTYKLVSLKYIVNGCCSSVSIINFE